MPIPTYPLWVMRMRSLELAEPSAVVKNISRPGISELPGFPSTSERISAALTKTAGWVDRSHPLKINPPSMCPLSTIVGAVADPLDLAKITAGYPLELSVPRRKPQSE